MIETSLDISDIEEAVSMVRDRLAENIPVAMSLVAESIASRAKSHHRYKDQTGALTNSIMSDGVSGSLFAGSLEASIGAGAPHGAPIEFGSRPHVIKPKQRQSLRWPVEGGFMFAKQVNHPGNEEYAPLGEALVETIDQSAETIDDAVTLSFAQAGLE